MRKVLLVLALPLLAVACKKSRSEKGAAAMPKVPVVAPFAAMDLPVGDGRVWFCDGRTMQIAHAGADKPALATRYGAAVEKAGWTRRFVPEPSPTQLLALFDRGGETLTLAVEDNDFLGKVPGGINVTLGIGPTPPAADQPGDAGAD